jgi:hypothetical protein
MRTLAVPFLIVLIAAVAGCTEDPIYYPWGDGGNVTPLDADGDDTSGPEDEDALLGDTDGSTDDTSVPDSGSDTAPPTDTTRPPEDTSPSDTSAPDTEMPDTETPDTETSDTETSDTETSDTSDSDVADCTLDSADCGADTPIFDAAACACVPCEEAEECGDGQSCTSTGACVVGTRTCESPESCDGAYCQGGFCAECVSSGDCEPDDTCVRGQCESCVCDAGELCDINGRCIAVADPTRCTTDATCEEIARALGYSGDGATCDPNIGCFTFGTCNGASGGAPDLGFGGNIDPFNAPCPAGTVCTGVVEIYSPSMFMYRCAGCDLTDPDACREGETCSVPLFDITSAGSTCGSEIETPFP